ncbi:MAG: alpha-L-fucosidase [Bacteroidales bacterium]|nr:alpha-L-fucosidase [Bacteroidales bacterium]
MKKSLYMMILLALSCLLPQAKAQYPQWFADAKLGIMVHYGLYSIPSYSGREQYAEWFYKGLVSNDTQRILFQQRVYGNDFGYFDYMPLFKAELFGAEQWMRLFKRAGARYFVFTTKHHDGFCLYPSKYTHYNVMNTPAKRDMVGELCQAAHREGLRVGLYYSLTEWTNPLFRWTVDQDTAMLENYVTRHMLPQFKEIVDHYRPELIFADGDWDFTARQLHASEMTCYHKAVVGNDAIANNRMGKDWDQGYLTPEYSSGINETQRPWAECRSIARSFGLNRASPLEDYQSADQLIGHFAQLVSMGGGLMLNVSPSADGSIPLLQQERLLELGEWLSVNGEAIYGARSAGIPMQTRQETRHRVDSVILFDWVRNGPWPHATEDHFQITWDGTLQVEGNGDYLFLLDADDSATLTVVGRGATHKADTVMQATATKDAPLRRAVRLKAGCYQVCVRYSECDIDASCSLLCAVNGQPAAPMKSATGWQAEITWQAPEVCFTANNGYLYAIALQPLGNSIVVPCPADEGHTDIAVASLLGCDKPLPCSRRGDRLVVDLSSLSPRDIVSQHAWVFRIGGRH